MTGSRHNEFMLHDVTKKSENKNLDGSRQANRLHLHARYTYTHSVLERGGRGGDMTWCFFSIVYKQD